jgi:hypothetical protein
MSNDSQAGKDRKTAIAPMLSVRNGKRAIEFVSHSSIDRLCQCGFIATWDRDTLAEELDIIEQATRKGRVKWMLTKPPNRLAHIDRVLSSPAFKGTPVRVKPMHSCDLPMPSAVSSGARCRTKLPCSSTPATS